MILSLILPADVIHASRVGGDRLHLEASPEHWSFGEWCSAGGILAAIFTWLWHKPVRKLRNMWEVPDKISGINKKLDMILAAVNLAVALGQNTWRAIDRALWQADSEGRIIHANSFMLTMLGRQENELLGNGWINSIHEDDRKRVADEWNRAVENEVNFYLHYRLVDTNGKIINVIGEAFRLTDAVGTLLGFMGCITVVK